MPDVSISRRTETVLLILILSVAGVLRMGWPGLTEFKADEARLLGLSLEMVENGRLAGRGISSSVGFPNFPMSVWLYALPLLVWRHVYAATLFTGLLNTLAVAGCYWFTRRYWGVSAALAASLMWADSPWAILFSRKIWAQNLLPLFVMLWAIGAVLAFVEQRPRFIWLHLLALAVAVQIHLAAVALVPVTAFYLLIFRRRVAWKMALAGFGLVLLTAVPFSRYLWQNLAQLEAGLSLMRGSPGSLDLDSWRFAVMLALGFDLHSLAGPEAFATYLEQSPNLTWAHVLWAFFIIGGVAWLAWQGWRHWGDPHPAKRRPAEAGIIVLLWLLLPLFFTWHSTPVFLHYLIALLPAPYIAAGAGFNRLFTAHCSLFTAPKTARIARITAWGLLIITAVAQLYAWSTLLTFLSTTATPGGFGVPLARQLTAVGVARTMLTETAAAEVLVAGIGESPQLDEFPAVYDVLLHDLPYRFVDVNRSALFPAAASVVLLAGDGGLADVYWETAVQTETIPLRPGEGALHVLAIPGAAAPRPDSIFATPHLFANWVSVYGYDEPVVKGDETAVWQLYWHTGGNPDPADYHFFNHLIDGEGQRVSQADAAAFSPAQWRAGDSVVSRFVLPWEDGWARPEAAGLRQPRSPFTIRTGMYIYPSLESVLLLDVAGNPYTDAVEMRLRD